MDAHSSDTHTDVYAGEMKQCEGTDHAASASPTADVDEVDRHHRPHCPFTAAPTSPSPSTPHPPVTPDRSRGLSVESGDGSDNGDDDVEHARARAGIKPHPPTPHGKRPTKEEEEEMTAAAESLAAERVDQAASNGTSSSPLSPSTAVATALPLTADETRAALAATTAAVAPAHIHRHDATAPAPLSPVPRTHAAAMLAAATNAADPHVADASAAVPSLMSAPSIVTPAAVTSQPQPHPLSAPPVSSPSSTHLHHHHFPTKSHRLHTEWGWYLVSSVAGCGSGQYGFFIPSLESRQAAEIFARYSSEAHLIFDRIRQATKIQPGEDEESIAALAVKRAVHGEDKEEEDEKEEKSAAHNGAGAEWYMGGGADERMSSDGNEQATKRMRLPTEAEGRLAAAASAAPSSSADAAAIPAVAPPSPSPSSSSLSLTALPVDTRALSVLGTFGQDSFFSVSHRALGCAVLGVADGVGGWRSNGVDSGDMSRALMRAARDIALERCLRAALKGATESNQPNHHQLAFALAPSDVLTSAYDRVKASGEVDAGSTTACIVTLTPRPVRIVTQPRPKAPLSSPSLPFPVFDDSPTTFAAFPAITPEPEPDHDESESSGEEMEEEKKEPSREVKLVTCYKDSDMADVANAVALEAENLIALDQPAAAASESSSSHSEMDADDAATSSSTMPSSVAIPIPISIPATRSTSQEASNALLQSLSDGEAADSESESGESRRSISENEIYMSAANLGDSGWLIFRRIDDVYRVVEMSDLQREGRLVKQLAVVPQRFQHDSYCDDSPAEAMLEAHIVQDNDILVLASDGLWDNLIAGEWDDPTFLFGMRSSEENARVNRQRKQRMLDVLECIAAECNKQLAEKVAAMKSEQQQQHQSGEDEHDHDHDHGDLSKRRSPQSLTSAAPSTTVASTASSGVLSASHSRCGSSTTLSMLADGCMELSAEASTMDAETGKLSSTMEMDAVVMADAETCNVGETTASNVNAVIAESDKDAHACACTSSDSSVCDLDSLETTLMAELLKTYALKFMQLPQGKQDDLTICVAKVKRSKSAQSLTPAPMQT